LVKTSGLGSFTIRDESSSREQTLDSKEGRGKELI